MEHGHVHNCLLVLADMGGMVNEDEGSRGVGPDTEGRTGTGARPGEQSGAGHESRNFTFSQREPFVFGTFIHPSEVPGMRGESGGAQAGPGGPPPGMLPDLFNMGQFFRLAGPPTGADDSANASNRRSTATASSMVRLGAVPPTAHAWRLLRARLVEGCAPVHAVYACSVRHVCADMCSLYLFSSLSLSLALSLYDSGAVSFPSFAGGAKFTPAAAASSGVLAAHSRPERAWK